MQVNRKNLWLRVKKILGFLFYSLGALAFLLLFFSFTRIPYDVQQWLGSSRSNYKFYPDEIVFLGGSGMPSESNLIRLYYTGELSKKYPQARIMIVHPVDNNVIPDMHAELILRGVDPEKIDILDEGTNTRDQVVNLAKVHPELLKKHVLLITSPESMLRTAMTFRKAGFESIGGHSASDNPMYADLRYDFKKSGGKIYSPDVSGNLALRYNFWNYLKIEISCIREFVAIGYYWVNGWI